MYDDILLPTDGSAGMERVITHAGTLAREHGATVHALYVVDATGFSDLPMETSWEGLRDLLQQEGETALEQVDRLLADLPVDHVIQEGSPASEIVRYTEEHGVDVVVMGTHGRGGLDRLLLGSVAERVVRRSHVPVLTVRVGESAADASPAPAGASEPGDDDARGDEPGDGPGEGSGRDEVDVPPGP